MGPAKDPIDRLLEGRELPRELVARFNSWNISRQEQDSFRDRMWAAQPTREEIASLARASNPWAVLGELEARPLPADRARARPSKESSSAPQTSSISSSTAETTTDRAGAETEPTPLAEAELPREHRANPYADRLRDMSDADLFEFYTNFIKLYHLDSPYAVPRAMLKDSKLLIYEALVAEVGCRKRS